jgi:hypothetical protein
MKQWLFWILANIALIPFVVGTLLVPDVGEVLLLKYALNFTAAENQKLKLFATNVTPAEGDTAGTYTEAAGGGYAEKALTGSSWTVSTTSGTTSGVYAAQTFTFTGALTTNPTIYGYYVVAATAGTLLWAELAAATFTPASNGDTYVVTPKIELA